jgi:hypothetical protein
MRLKRTIKIGIKTLVFINPPLKKSRGPSERGPAPLFHLTLIIENKQILSEFIRGVNDGG